MTGHQTTPDMTKTPAQSAKTSARALQEGTPTVTQSNRTLPEVDEQLVASWPVGPERAAARRAYRLMLSAGAALEELLQDAPAPVGRDAEIMHAATALTQIRAEDAPTAHFWQLDVSKHDDEPVQLEGAVYEWSRPKGFDLRDAMGQWAKVTDGTVTEKVVSTGKTHLDLVGVYMGVPVKMSAIIDAPAGGAL